MGTILFEQGMEAEEQNELLLETLKDILVKYDNQFRAETETFAHSLNLWMRMGWFIVLMVAVRSKRAEHFPESAARRRSMVFFSGGRVVDTKQPFEEFGKT